MVKINQIRAARGLLGWHQKDLARMAGISELSVVNIENGKTKPHQNTLDRIIGAFELAGVGFTPTKVEMKDTSFTVLSGDGWYLRMLEDIERTIQMLPEGTPKEDILFYAKGTRASDQSLERIRALLKKGLTARYFIKEGDTFLQDDISRYRYIPAAHYHDILVHCYGDKIAIINLVEGAGGDHGAVHIFRNAALASVVRNIGNMLWEILPQPKASTAEEKDLYRPEAGKQNG